MASDRPRQTMENVEDEKSEWHPIVVLRPDQFDLVRAIVREEVRRALDERAAS